MFKNETFLFLKTYYGEENFSKLVIEYNEYQEDDDLWSISLRFLSNRVNDYTVFYQTTNLNDWLVFLKKELDKFQLEFLIVFDLKTFYNEDGEPKPDLLFEFSGGKYVAGKFRQ